MKSDVKDYLELAELIYLDASAQCSVSVSDFRDLRTLRSRVKNEGFSFLTITLPSFSADLERAVERGGIGPDLFPSFRKRGAIPAFLQGMLGHIFDVETGELRDVSPNLLEVLEGVRQFCLAFKKIKVPCSPAREVAAIKRFISVEQSFTESPVDPGDATVFKTVAFVLWNRMLGSLLPDMLLPKHGPGATAERLHGNQKYVWRRWHERLEPFFSFFGYAYSLSADESQEFKDVTFVSVDQERPVRVVFVPKTLKAPRVIAIEPVCMQYTQQALQAWLYETIEHDPLVGGQINFSDQSINQEIALSSSVDGRFSTIDLSDASDRVPRDLALSMFDSNPDLRDAIDACRSRRAELPTGQVIDLQKFASMGSALCFPVEAMYFYTICVVALLDKRKLSATRRNIAVVAKDIYVYGDDIAVPTDDTEFVLGYLHKYKCKVNVHKTFWNGKFRESCGLDAFAGRVVTPTYIREQRPENKQQAERLVSWVTTANFFRKKGYDRTASSMFAHVEAILGPLPLVYETSPLLGRWNLSGSRVDSSAITRYSNRYHRLEQRGWVVAPVGRSDRIDGYAALQKSLLRLEYRGSSSYVQDIWAISEAHNLMLRWLQTTGAQTSSLERSVRRGAVSLKRRWVPVT